MPLGQITIVRILRLMTSLIGNVNWKNDQLVEEMDTIDDKMDFWYRIAKGWSQFLLV